MSKSPFVKPFFLLGFCLVSLMMSSCSSMKHWVQENIIKDEVYQELHRSKPKVQYQGFSKGKQHFGPQDPQRATSEPPFGFTWSW